MDTICFDCVHNTVTSLAFVTLTVRHYQQEKYFYIDICPLIFLSLSRKDIIKEQTLYVYYCDGSYCHRSKIGICGYAGQTFRPCTKKYKYFSNSTACEVQAVTLLLNNSKVEQLITAPLPKRHDKYIYPAFFRELKQCKCQINVKHVRGHMRRNEQCTSIEYEFACVDKLTRKTLRKHVRWYKWHQNTEKARLQLRYAQIAMWTDCISTVRHSGRFGSI
ncbi:unnamed protein product [Didymodactylos carnosus]|uniref:Uncharacterized protein n=1 Tax=Didymodactylos carnosus TaxID=1234261 RepID=A0A814LN92_9BILA|nr:unnamed protein product [Didymodactylos carnosus]CAF3834571.1 unnamed protein product [Didymodactylos carnosus]